jgi:hypothetical protein
MCPIVIRKINSIKQVFCRSTCGCFPVQCGFQRESGPYIDYRIHINMHQTDDSLEHALTLYLLIIIYIIACLTRIRFTLALGNSLP